MRLVFWNCGVAPARGNRSASRAEAAIKVVEDLARPRPAVIALCEADTELVQDLMSVLDLKRQGYRERVLNDVVGNSRWDLALLLDHRQVALRKLRPITVRVGGRHLRAAYPLRVETSKPLENLRFELFLAHWPSRLRGGAGEDRRLCATALRRAVERRLHQGTRVVVLGDFNDEPHDMALSENLRASRDPEIVCRKARDRLYNPSWWLGSPTLGNSWGDFGTTRYESPASGTRWHTLDQALTCHQWLDRAEDWAPEVRALRRSPDMSLDPFDHVPIELRLTR